jgi:hypothetical protein
MMNCFIDGAMLGAIRSLIDAVAGIFKPAMPELELQKDTEFVVCGGNTGATMKRLNVFRTKAAAIDYVTARQERREFSTYAIEEVDRGAVSLCELNALERRQN